jgi:hypothetical protein
MVQLDHGARNTLGAIEASRRTSELARRPVREARSCCILEAWVSLSGILVAATSAETAMVDSVDMFRDGPAPNRCSCTLAVWELLHELGRAFGWRPVGTTYVLPAKSTIELPARRNYEPGDSEDMKQVTTEDAIAWASALEKAKHSSHAAAMIDARSAALASSGKLDGGLPPGAIDEFIAFAYGGSFEFSIR